MVVIKNPTWGGLATDFELKCAGIGGEETPFTLSFEFMTSSDAVELLRDPKLADSVRIPLVGWVLSSLLLHSQSSLESS